MLSDLETGEMGQEIVANEEAHEHPVVDGPLKVVGEGEVGHLQIAAEVFPENGQTHENVLDLLAKVVAVFPGILGALDGFGGAGAVFDLSLIHI